MGSYLYLFNSKGIGASIPRTLITVTPLLYNHDERLMNNLLRTLTEARVKPPGDLKLLLTAVKETRKQEKLDNKPLDVFTESLDNLLADLRTITIDNRDAEAFLKPVSRAEVPDYYDYITNPMDFQTMARKIKQKSYKSKREFKDDLDLIWSNCYKYNAVEDHPLRQCADRLKAKAERLLNPGSLVPR
ncbi:hypothetical protein NMY22_g16866 [Coprinellus aureogranulatus]|nr:hypothetical protein NMY22_g16866 [Coprinellus aureogranulatus]